jgi:hypothetical protein
MAQNPIQFQQGMSLSMFVEQYGTEAQCEAALLRARWPDGFVSLECDGHVHARLLVEGRWYWRCRSAQRKPHGAPEPCPMPRSSP